MIKLHFTWHFLADAIFENLLRRMKFDSSNELCLRLLPPNDHEN
jgi:hypothetical protein